MMFLIMVASAISGCLFDGEEQKYELADTTTIADGGTYYIVGSSEGRVTGYNSYAWELDHTPLDQSSQGDFSWDVLVLIGVNCDNFQNGNSFVGTSLSLRDMTESGSMERQGTDSNDDFCFIVDNTDGDESLKFTFRVYGWK